MNKYKIVITDYYYPSLTEEYKEFERLGAKTEIVDCTRVVPGGIKNPDELLPYVADADALIVQFAKIPAELIDKLEKCKVIARYAIGVDTIDLEAAAKKGIYVANVPDYCIDEVADTAAAHILCCMRRLMASRDMLLQGCFEMDRIRPVRRLKNCTLGLLGFGNISRNLAGKMKSFFGRIMVSDPYFQGEAEYPELEFTTQEQLLRESDVISIHVPLSESTRNMISTEEFSLMKKGVVLVNTSRGGIIDEDALWEALERGQAGGCGLDVLAVEDFHGSRFLTHPRVVLTPHTGWCSEEAMLELQRKTARNVVETLLNGRPVYCAGHL